jgi:hypothetical protein
MRLFRKRKSPNRAQQVTSNLIKDAMRFVQHRWVLQMQRWERRCSVRQKKWALILFCATGCIYSGVVLVDAFQEKQPVSAELPTTPVMHGPVLHLPAPKITAKDSAALLGFKMMVDSLAAFDSGRAVLKELQSARPGLLDSLYNIEQLIY